MMIVHFLNCYCGSFNKKNYNSTPEDFVIIEIRFKTLIHLIFFFVVVDDEY